MYHYTEHTFVSKHFSGKIIEKIENPVAYGIIEWTYFNEILYNDSAKQRELGIYIACSM